MTQQPVQAGQQLGRLTIVSEAAPRPRSNGDKRRFWNVHCNCGNDKVVCQDSLVRGTISCGCFNREKSRAVNTKHGEGAVHKRTPEYRIWLTMNSRCRNPNVKAFKDYGGRGISVCQRWQRGQDGKSGYECFLLDMGRRPSVEYSLDRYPNNDGNYEPGNVRWATDIQQHQNKRKVHLVTVNGAPFTLRDACKHLQIGYSAARHLLRRGYSPDESIASLLAKRAMP